MTDKQPEKQLIFDHIIVVCQGCRVERTFYPDANVKGAEGLIAWMATLQPCACGATKCTIKAHMKH